MPSLIGGLFEVLGDQAGQAHTHMELGAWLSYRDRLTEALDHTYPLVEQCAHDRETD